jgi:hypothetical protein
MRTRQNRKSPSRPGRAIPQATVVPTARDLVESAQIPPAKFEEVLAAFGDLPESGRRELAERLIRAAGIYRLRKSIEKQGFPSASEKWERLEDISVSARRLLKLLGVKKPEDVAEGLGHPGLGHPLHSVTTTDVLTGLYRVALQRRPSRGAVDAWEQMETLIVLLSDLVAVTVRAEQKPEGAKKGQSAEGELMHEIIDLYARLRDRFPKSGPEPRYDPQFRNFVRKFLGAAEPTLASDARITDAAIRGAFNRWRRRARIETRSAAI